MTETPDYIEPLETHFVPSLPDPIRLQEYGVAIFKSVETKSALKKLLKKQCITVNDKEASYATLIKGGEIIKLYSPSEEKTEQSLMISLKVLYEDEYLAVIQKPAGIVVNGNKFRTIDRALSHNLKSSTVADKCKPRPAHRLDYATSGTLLIGKTRKSIRLLNKLFEKRAVKKIYYAVAVGKMNEMNGHIQTKIEGKKSDTEYSVIDSVDSKKFGTLNLLELIPLTGRRHQLRIHLSELGHPILGDKIYTPENLIHKGKGMYLHAKSLEFVHPFTGEKLYIEDELPNKFKSIFQN